MSANSRNKKTMRALGIAKIEWKENHGITATWAVTLDNGDVLTINTHHFCTDTGVLRQAATMLKPRYA